MGEKEKSAERVCCEECGADVLVEHRSGQRTYMLHYRSGIKPDEFCKKSGEVVS